MKFIHKLTSYLLLGAVSFSEFTPLALALDQKLIKESTNTITSNEVNFTAKGTLEVETHLLLPIRNREDIDINLTIYDENNNHLSISMQDILTAEDGYYMASKQLGEETIRINASKRDKDGHLLSGIDYNNNVVYLAMNFYDMLKGTYKIELKGKNFVTYTQEVTLDNFSKRVNITNEKGLFTIGDVNGDNLVNEDDINVMLEAIQNNDLTKDLNYDGITNIADLNYVTAGVYGEVGTVKIEKTNPIIESENITLETNAIMTENSNDLESIFTDDGVVTFEQVDDKPIELALNLISDDDDAPLMSEVRIDFGENIPQEAMLVVETVEGERIEKAINLEDVNDIHLFTDEINKEMKKINLGQEVAVKKVTIVITKTGSNNLADIAKVEFLNNVKVQTKEPENFYTPRNVMVKDDVSEQVTVSFQSVPNVTGYEIKINGPKMTDVIFQTTYTTFTIEDLKNYANYEIAVRAVNQEWRSGWSDVIIASPQATRRPPAVDMVVFNPTYSGFDLSWKDMDDTKSYNIYYREVGSEDWLKITDVTGTKYSIRGLKAQTKYEAYLTGNNDLGEGSKSQTVLTTTLEQTATIYPKYKLINSYDNNIGRTSHILDVIYNIGETYTVDDDKNIIPSDKWAMVDDDYKSYWEIKDWQVAAHSYNYGAPIIVLDQTYKMDEFVITIPDSYSYNYKGGTFNPNAQNKNDILVHYWNGERNQNNKTTVQGTLIAKYDENKRKYYVLKLENPIEANALQFGLTVENNNKLIQIAEVKFYEYDSLVDDVAALFTDDLRVELQKGVTKDTIAALRQRANVQNNGEYNPYRESILNDLDYAEKILNDEKLNDVVTLNPNISNEYNKHLGFAMSINDYQPLGVAVKEGDQLTIYVGSKGNVNVQVVFTQTYAEANAWNKAINLVKGQNIITVPKIGNASSERGGSVYIRYTSTPDGNNPIKVRVSGGVKIPVLDTTLLDTETAKKDAINTYISELETYVNNLPSLYQELYQDSEEKMSYDKFTSAFGVTEIVTRHGLWSFSAEAVRDAINSGLTLESAKVERLYESTEAFDEMMLLFYRHKGLEENAQDKNNELPKARINIRYMRMFDGAFMYAGGYHIGIEYGSIAGVIQGKKNSDSLTGYFGWGISHEVGHQINQGSLVFAEVTNNVYALLAQTANDKDLSRLEISNIYDKIYDKVTSHTLGRNQNVFVTLAMYWQLHLAYDNNKTFTDTDSIFARINKISRTYKNTNNYSKDDLLILFASMAANKDLTDYFNVWGINASESVKNEISTLNLVKEDKAIYYLNDAARRYRLNNGVGITNSNILTASIKEQNDAEKRVTITFDVNSESDKILGYEILRNGEAIAFVSSNTHEFTDNIGSVNNRAFTYEVVAYDYLLNKTNAYQLEEVKVAHDGSVKKDTFTIESNFKGANEIVDFENIDMDYKSLSVNNLIDNDLNSWFNGNERIRTLNSTNSSVGMTNDNNDAYVIISLNTQLSLSGIKYRAHAINDELDIDTIKNYKISISSDKEHWTEVATGTFNLNKDNDYTNTIYFMKENTTSQTQLWTYHDIAYIKIESVGNKIGISGAEIDIIAPPGDNIDITSIGKLQQDYCYLTNGCNETQENGDFKGLIKAGSVIFTGTYAGSPSFNLLTINDAVNTNEIFEGYQVLFAEVNDDLTVYEVSKGTWIYVMTEEQYQYMLTKTHSIRATLYRVSDAYTMKDQRITSTSLKTDNLPNYNDLEDIIIEGLE